MPTSDSRKDGWSVRYDVDVIFDTDSERHGYDYVGTSARCSCCGTKLDRCDVPSDLVAPHLTLELGSVARGALLMRPGGR